MVKEVNAIIRSKDEQGNTIITYPVTTKGNITDLEEATYNESGLLSSSDKAKLDKVTYTFGSDDKGFYIETI